MAHLSLDSIRNFLDDERFHAPTLGVSVNALRLIVKRAIAFKKKQKKPPPETIDLT